MRNALPDPASDPDLFEGILARRVVANVIDCIIMTVLLVILTAVTGVTGFFTLGLAWLALPLLTPVVIVLYYAVTLGSPRRATVGMRMMDIVLTPVRGAPLDGWRAYLHAFAFWVSVWVLWPLLLIGLFTPRRQLLHDLLFGVLMVRRSPMERHWARMEQA